MGKGTVVNKALGLIGLEVRRKSKVDPHVNRQSIHDVVLFTKDLGWKPRTVIDIGVANGTPGLYDVYPDARLLLIEPLEEYERDLSRISLEHNGDYVIAAAAATEGSVTFNVHPDLSGSSSLRETEGAHADGIPREIRTVRVDDMVSQFGLKAPFLIKVDVQGAELEALSGAEDTLIETGLVILEVSLFPFMVGGAQLLDVVSFMGAKGFATYDIFGRHTRPLDGALAQVDMAFVREDGPFRSRHGYFASPEQRIANQPRTPSSLRPAE